ncbi:MAG: hypothetical protein Q8O67_02280 [Deltaproteobacteria bacterium]|nr:hypothetical protein [Deltaproteobacteria bacterium]
MRRAQNNLLPPTRKQGDAAVADVLWRALDAAAIGADAADADVPHGFHSWPAGMHPAIAKTLLDAFDGDVVDPFSGGGTVGLEALLHGRRFFGIDLNPLSARIGAVRCRPRDADNAADLADIVDAVTEKSKERVRKKVRVHADVDAAVAKAFLPHTLLELAGLLAEIAAVDDDDARKTLAMVFSSILTKVSLRRGDTDVEGEPREEKKIGRFFPSELFQEKAQQLIERQHGLWRRVGYAGPKPVFVVDDARRLPELVKRTRLIVSSPPYGGTYDYAFHHAHRIAFLKLDDSALRAGELGARRNSADSTAFDDDVSAMLRAMAAVLDADGLAILLLGDGHVGGRRVPADVQLSTLAAGAGLMVKASSSAPRRDWRGGPDREEHLVALARR